MSLLQKIFNTCPHKWVEIERGSRTESWGDGPKFRVGIYFIYQCELCKKLKKVTL